MGTQSLCAERGAPSSGGTWPHIRLWALVGFRPSPSGTTMGGGGLLAGPHGADPPSSLTLPEASEVSAPAFALLPFRLFPPFCFLLPCFIRDLSFHLWSLTWMAERSFNRTSHSSAQNLIPSRTRSPGQVPESPVQFVPCNIINSVPSDLFLLHFAPGIRSPCCLWLFLSCSYCSWGSGTLSLLLKGSSTDISLVHSHFLKVFPQTSHH